MKYYLFSGAEYYAAGGARDFIKSSDDLEHLLECANELLHGGEDIREDIRGIFWSAYDWYHITDEDMNIVAKSDKQAHS